MSASATDAAPTQSAAGGARRARWWLCVLGAAATACTSAPPPADSPASDTPANSADSAPQAPQTSAATVPEAPEPSADDPAETPETATDGASMDDEEPRPLLTVTATDSSNMASSASVSVSVKVANDAPTARADIVHSRAGRAQAAAVLANDTDPEGDMDPWSVRVVVPGALGAAAANSPTPGAVAYEPASAGIDVIVYEVCDRLLQCSSAELVVAVLEDL